MAEDAAASFAALGLPPKLVEALALRQITEPFDIQRLTVPDAVAGRDILARAPTGSGKTLAFGLPLLARIGKASKRRPTGLILSPTRELAEQISRELEPLAQSMGRSVAAVYGGVAMSRHIKALNRGVDVLVACPGRLIDLIEQGAVALNEVEIAVVDEADRMADMGFLPDVRQLLDLTPDGRQMLLFSATLDGEVKVLTDTYQHDPAHHEVGEVEPDLSLVDHRFIQVRKTERIWLAADIIADAGPTVVFVRTRHGVDRLARQLRNEGIAAGYIHGGRTQSQRDRALEVFTKGKVQALVATDVAARGIHVDGVACVIHYDPPAEYKDYVHRSGRTARAGAAGVVVSFLDKPQVAESKKMRRKLGLEAELEPTPAQMPRSSRPAAIRGTGDSSADTRSRSKSKSGPKSRPASKSKSRPESKTRPPSRSRSESKPRSESKSRSESKPRSESKSRPESKPRSDSQSRPESKTRPPSKSRTASKSKTRPTSKPSSKRSEFDNDFDGDALTSQPSPRRSKPGPRQGSSTKNGAGPKKRSSGKPGAKSSNGRKPGSSDRSSTNGDSGRGSGGDESSSPRKPRSKGPTGSGTKAKKASAPGRGPKSKVKSKRSGKPRPKNRKNKATGRRTSSG